MNLRQILEDGIVTEDEIMRAQGTLRTAGLESAGSSMILHEMGVQRETSAVIGRCRAYRQLSAVMLAFLPFEILNSPMPSMYQVMFEEMAVARDKLREIIKK